MFEIEIVQFSNKTEKPIRFIRETVFIHEQNVSPELEFDGLDGSATHALISIEGKYIATGRLLDDGHIGRVAILKAYRNQKLGSKLVLSLIEEAKQKGYSRVYLGSQTHAIGFYQKLGFSAFGEEFMEAGIPHLSMEKTLL